MNAAEIRGVGTVLLKHIVACDCECIPLKYKGSSFHV